MEKMKLRHADDLSTEAMLCAALEEELNAATQEDRDGIQALANKFFGRHCPPGTIAYCTIAGYYFGLSAGFRIYDAIGGGCKE